tara:strand:- start:5107 stop:5325 length:219 start_codon:yes stop_codon:yes gene_type:complete
MNIEKDIPLPPKGRGRPAKYPFGKMDVDDSVFFEGEKAGGRVYNAAMVFGRNHSKRFVGRVADGGLRIFRVE